MPNLTITLVQMNISWLNPSENFLKLSRLLADVEATDLIVLPETFSSGFAFDQPDIGEPENGPALRWLTQTASDKDAVVVGSIAVRQGDKTVNRLYWVTPGGEVSFYDKRHLFRMAGEHNYVIPGDRRQVFSVKDVRFLPTVCYDLRFPVWSRNKNDYDVLLNVANWPAARRRIWDTLLQARAIENQCYVIGVNRVGDDGKGIAYSGGTAAYDFSGDTLAKAADNEQQVVTVTLNMRALKKFKRQFPAHLDSDTFELT